MAYAAAICLCLRKRDVLQRAERYLRCMAENAAEHGISERPDGGTVRIASRETEQACLVTAEGGAARPYRP